MVSVEFNMKSATDQDSILIQDISIILVCWNNKDYLGPCLRSLFDGELKHSFEVIVVDNGSTDGSQDMLKETFPQVKIIQNNSNVGLSRASNQGILASHGRAVLLLNNDTLVNGTAIDLLVDFMESRPDTGGVGGKLLNPDGSFQSGYARFSTLMEEFLVATGLGNMFWEGYPLNLDSDRVTEVDWMSSACLLIRRSALDQIGLLDEKFFIYGDEVDLQYRLQEAGWKVHYIPDATTIHYGGRSMNRWRRRKMVYRGKLLFYQKNYGAAKTGILRVMLLLISLAKWIAWVGASIFPRFRERAKLELRSNQEVMHLCLRPE